MFTVIWLINFFVAGNASLAFNTMPFWGLVVAVLADLFLFSPFGRKYWVTRTV